MVSDWSMTMGLLAVSEAVELLVAEEDSRRFNAAKASARGESAGSAGRPPVNGSSRPCTAVVSTPDIVAADGSTIREAGVSEAAEVASATGEFDESVACPALPFGSPDDAPAAEVEFAAPPETIVALAEFDALEEDGVGSVFEYFEPVLAPPVPTA